MGHFLHRGGTPRNIHSILKSQKVAKCPTFLSCLLFLAPKNKGKQAPVSAFNRWRVSDSGHSGRQHSAQWDRMAAGAVPFFDGTKQRFVGVAPRTLLLIAQEKIYLVLLPFGFAAVAVDCLFQIFVGFFNLDSTTSIVRFKYFSPFCGLYKPLCSNMRCI